MVFNMLFTAHKDAAVDYDGTEIKEFHKELDSPFVPFPGGGLNKYCYVIYQGLFGKYKIRQCEVVEVWFTNIWGWRMDNGWTFISDELDKTVFKYDKENLNKAIEICEKKNRMRKVKVKHL